MLGMLGRRAAAPDASGRFPRSAGRRRSSARSSPWATAARSSASAAAWRSWCRARRLELRISAMAFSMRACHELMHRRGIVALDEIGRPAAAAEETAPAPRARCGPGRRVADLVAVQMQDRQHGAVGDRIEELVGLPGGRQRAGFRLAVADDAGDDQVGIVERGAEGMAERIAELAALVDRARRRRRDMAGNAAGKRELLEQLFQAGFVLRDVRIDLAPGAFEIDIADQAGPP
jgi:hypothetical protein